MDPERWRRVRQLFDLALDREPAQRVAFLEEACAGDKDLEREVLSLLDSEAVSQDVLADVVASAVSDTSSAAAAELPSGEKLGRYTIVERLGSGGMGDVYVAEDTELRRKVALKVLADWMTPDAGHLDRFRREARVLAGLNHSNIVTIYSVEREGSLHFITMELVEGKTLDRLIPAEGFAIEQFFSIALPLVRAVAAAHENGVTHRDLKPANVMLGDDGEVKILDFGLAKRRHRDETGGERGFPSDTLTRTGAVMGTFPYMSPEQAQGKTLDRRSDIFSLGVILYEMATGSRPFAGDSSADLISSILKEEPPPIHVLARHLPPRLGQIIKRCLHKEPERRYQDATSLARELAALREAVEHHPMIATGLSRLSALMPRTRLPGRGLTVMAAVLAVIIIGLNLDPLKRWLVGTPRSPEIASLAVLPFTNLSGDTEQEYLADGMTEVLITELSKISAFKVISRTSVMRFKNPEQPLVEIAEELAVDGVVEGSVLRSQDRVRVTAQLIHAASDEHLWAESFERDMRDVLTLQGEVARAIAAQVQVTLTPEELARLERTESVDPRASEAYLRGRNYWNNFSLARAAEAYEEAIDFDPEFARAWAGLAETRQIQGTLGFPHPPRVSYPLAQAAVNRALDLDEGLAKAHAVQGWINLQFEWDWEAAESEFRRAIELNPGSPEGHTGLSYYLAAMGRFDEAVESAERARELDPLSRFGKVMWCEILYYARRYERALFELGEEWDQDFAPTYWIYGRLLQARGDAKAAAWADFRTTRQNPLARPWVEDLQQAIESTGAAGYWQEMLNFQTAWPEEAIHAKIVAESHARLGEISEALEWLDRAYERRDSLAHLGVDPIWDPLRSDPRFEELLIDLKLPQAAEFEP